MNKIKIAIVGMGNCASSLIQGIHYYDGKNKNKTIKNIILIILGIVGLKFV